MPSHLIPLSIAFSRCTVSHLPCPDAHYTASITTSSHLDPLPYPLPITIRTSLKAFTLPAHAASPFLTAP